MNNRIAFNTANFVARVSGYRFSLARWGEQHARTVAATDEAAWRAICHDIARAGYTAVEVWEAHASPDALSHTQTLVWREIMDEAGLAPAGYAGQLNERTVQVCRWLGIDHINGGLSLPPVEAAGLCRESGVRFHFENHPEKSAAEIRDKVGGGSEFVGVCIDTGWLGTQNVSAPDTIRALGSLVRHVHVKDVRAPDGHETCRLGDGVVDLPGTFAALREMGYEGWYSWEDEPEDRNPLDTAEENRAWIKARLA
jgi:sugar phosphate isomerase/epimerase